MGRLVAYEKLKLKNIPLNTLTTLLPEPASVAPTVVLATFVYLNPP